MLAMAVLPNAHQAIVPVEKLRDYSLNAAHPRGRNKARVFAATLDLRQDGAEWLARVIREEVVKCPARELSDEGFGSRFEVDMVVRQEGRSARVRTGWIIRAGEILPRLTTCFVLV